MNDANRPGIRADSVFGYCLALECQCSVLKRSDAIAFAGLAGFQFQVLDEFIDVDLTSVVVDRP